MNSIAIHSTRFVCIRGMRVLAVLACMGLAQAAFAQKAEFERTKPHVNVGTIGHIDLEPIPDPILLPDRLQRQRLRLDLYLAGPHDLRRQRRL